MSPVWLLRPIQKNISKKLVKHEKITKEKMLTSDQFDSLITPITELYTEYETTVLKDIARRVKNLDFSSAAWQAQRLTESGSLYKNVLKELSRLTGQSEAQIAEILKRAGVKAINFDDKIYKDAGLNPLPLNLSPAMLIIFAPVHFVYLSQFDE